MDFLKTFGAVEQYAKLAIKHGGNTQSFKKAWLDTLDEHNAITQDVNESDLQPAKLVDAIATAVKNDVVFKHFNPVFNIDAGVIAIETQENAVGALGHKRNATKTIQQTTLAKRTVMPEAIYKLQRLDHMTFLKGGALVQWVLAELPKYVLKRISQAILVGGVVNEDGTPFTAITPIKGDELALTGTALPASYTGEDLKNALISDLAQVESDAPVIFMSPAAWSKMALTGDAWSVAMLTDNLKIGGALERTPLLKANETPYLIVDPDAYFLGFAGAGIETLSDFVITSNSQYIESRAYVAGTLRAGNGAIVPSVATA